ncbi:MAG: hypothetical protein ACR2RF_28290 [Geminicoccaceae bacterium]
MATDVDDSVLILEDAEAQEAFSEVEPEPFEWVEFRGCCQLEGWRSGELRAAGIRSGWLVQLGNLLPNQESSASISTEIGGGLFMALKMGEVGDGFMNGEKLLSVSG